MSRFEQRRRRRLRDPNVRAGYWEAEAEVHILDALDHARRAMGMTQEELGRRLGCSQAAVSQFFGAETGITIGRLVDYLEALGLLMRVELAKAGDGDLPIIIEGMSPP